MGNSGEALLLLGVLLLMELSGGTLLLLEALWEIIITNEETPMGTWTCGEVGGY